MGRTNIENRSKDKNWGYNETKQARFKFELMNDDYTRRLELANGLMMFKLTKSIKLNAYYDVSMNDILVIKGEKLKVTTITTRYDNANQGRYKANLKDFTGETVVGLE